MRISDWSSDVCSSDLIRVNVLSPGPTATELAKAAVGEDGLKVFASMNPLRRMAEPTEVAAGAAFLASNARPSMTAHELAVHGGPAPLSPGSASCRERVGLSVEMSVVAETV